VQSLLQKILTFARGNWGIPQNSVWIYPKSPAATSRFMKISINYLITPLWNSIYTSAYTSELDMNV